MSDEYVVEFCDGECQERTMFEYVGPQMAGPIRMFDYYTCTVCETTRAMNHSSTWFESRNSPDGLRQVFVEAGE